MKGPWLIRQRSTALNSLAPTYLPSQTPTRFLAWVDGVAIEQGKRGNSEENTSGWAK